jgi:hypothetical protein
MRAGTANCRKYIKVATVIQMVMTRFNVRPCGFNRVGLGECIAAFKKFLATYKDPSARNGATQRVGARGGIGTRLHHRDQAWAFAPVPARSPPPELEERAASRSEAWTTSWRMKP